MSNRSNILSRRAQFFASLRPFFEATVLCVLLRLAEVLFDRYGLFYGSRADLYWAPILLIVAQYGTLPAVWAATLSTALLYIGRLPTMTPSDDFYSYWWRVGIAPLPWFVAATVLGELVMRHRRARIKMQEELNTIKAREEVFLAAFAELETLKDQREHELAAVTSSPAQIFKIFSKVDPKLQQSIVDCTLDLVQALLQPQKCSLFLVRGTTMRLIRSLGWNDADSFEEQFSYETPLFREVIVLKRVLSVAEESDRDVVRAHGLVAVPLFDPKTEKVFGMIKVERAQWSQLTLSHRSTLAMAGQWAGAMLSYANHFKVAYLSPQVPISNQDESAQTVPGVK